MIETITEIFDPKYKGVYPQNSYFVNNIGYFVYNDVPLLIYNQKYETHMYTHWRNTALKRIIFFATTLLSNKHFPVHNFSPANNGSVHIKCEKFRPVNEIWYQIKEIMKGNTKVPILNNPYKKTNSYDEAQKIIKRLRGKEIYIDLFNSNKTDFKEHLEELAPRFDFSEYKEHNVNSDFVQKYYFKFLDNSRYIHIALYYYLNAGRLINNNFIEDGGLNLNLVLEALIKDYMDSQAIKDKKIAIAELFERLEIGEDLSSWYYELYESRNKFLAHIDEYMFTDKENINDPDGYCFDHYEDVSDLILKYLHFKESE